MKFLKKKKSDIFCVAIKKVLFTDMKKYPRSSVKKENYKQHSYFYLFL